MKRDRLAAAEENERRSQRLRARFGLADNPTEDRVRDWLLGSGAVPATIAIAAIVVYILISLISSLFGS